MEEAVIGLYQAFRDGLLPNSFDDDHYFNVPDHEENQGDVMNQDIALVTGVPALLAATWLTFSRLQGLVGACCGQPDRRRLANIQHHEQNLTFCSGSRYSNLTPEKSYFHRHNPRFHFAGIGDIVPSLIAPGIQYVRKTLCRRFSYWSVFDHRHSEIVYAAFLSCYLRKPQPGKTNPIDPKYPYALSKYQGEQSALH